MSAALDSSVLIAALVEAELHHDACGQLLDPPRKHVYAHALSEAYSVLTGGRLGFRVSPEIAVQLLEQSVLPNVEVVTLSARELIASLKEAPLRGVRGAAIYDYLHLAAARKPKLSASIRWMWRTFRRSIGREIRKQPFQTRRNEALQRDAPLPAMQR